MHRPEAIQGLDPHQRELEKALNEKSEVAANIYLGAVLLSRQGWNPDRVSLCSHGLRELMNLLPKFIDVPLVKEARQQLGQFVDRLVEDWKTVETQGNWPGDPPWQGSIDDGLRKLLVRTRTVVEAHTNIREGRRIQVKGIIKKQNFSAVPLPSNIEDLKAEEWETYRDYFVKTAHHATTTDEDFNRYLTHFEHLLLGYLKPRTFDTHAELLTLIEEAQGDK
jgi:hypothetical protein